MKLFQCERCGNTLYFENTKCEKCSSALGYLPEESALIALTPEKPFHLCANAKYSSCNWLVPENEAEFCAACRHNQTIPDLSAPGNLEHWRRYEFAKHRLVYSLIALRVPIPTRAEDPENGLAFDFLAETPAEPHVITGHDHGLITLNLKEADDAERTRVRDRLNEPYRTLLGHLRHESGHYAWDRLVTGEKLEAFRKMFGDERVDYAEALRNHYAKERSADWNANFISAYASSHPWEDFAETWAHYLHIIDTLEMAASFREGSVRAYSSFPELIEQWLSLTAFMNSLNRCMGESDLYPFVLAPPVISKLEFIHNLVAPATNTK